MKLNDELTYSTLGWVKQELDASLKQARDALEAHVESADDEEHIRRCAATLHQVQGTLHIVELYGAALVAEEMEQLATACATGEVKEPEDAYGVLMRGIMQLPDYLDRLASGYRDIPIVLLSLLNDLRAARGGELLSESTVFTPRLDIVLPEAAAGPPSRLDGEELKAEVEKLRLVFQGALVRWFKNSDADQALARMRQVLSELVGLSFVESARRLWWVAAAVIEGLAEGKIKTTAPVKKLIGGVERQIKRLLDEGEGIFEREPPDDVTRSLLYYIAYAEEESDRMAAVQQAFQLREWVPRSEEMQHAEGSLSGHNRELLVTVGTAIKEDLLRVKEAFDLYLRTDEHDLDNLKTQTTALGRIADTLGMLGLGEQRAQVQQHRQSLVGMASGEHEVDEGALMEVASALLYVEASLDDHIECLGAVDNLARGKDQSEGSALPRAEMQRINQTLLKEAMRNLKRAKESIVAFIEAPWDHARLNECPNLLSEVIGGLRILEQEEASKLLQGVVTYLNRRLIETHGVPSTDELDTLADALESLEYYLGGLVDRRPGAHNAMELARRSVAELEFAQSAEVEAIESLETAEQTSSLEAVDMSAEGADDFEAASDIDDDIREVFIEEVTEELEHLRDLYPQWKEDTDDKESLTSIRRVFHTLKGSGRLVGADTIGEFSWGIENMLNRVLEGTRKATPAVFALMDDVVYDFLPQLLADLKGEEAVSFDIGAVEQTADALATGEEVEWREVARTVVEASAAVDETSEKEIAATVDTQITAAEADSAATEEDAAVLEFETADAEAPEKEAAPAESAAEPDAQIEATAETSSEDEPDESVDFIEFFEAPSDAPEALTDQPESIETVDTDALEFDLDERTAEDADIPNDAAAPGADAMDPALYDVFKKEADAHLLAISAFLNHASAHPERTPVSAELSRTVHTLHGAASMAGLEELTRVSGPLEDYIKALEVRDAYLGRDGFNVLQETLTAIETLVDQAGRAQPDYPDVTALINTLEALEAQTATLAPAPPHEVEAPESEEEEAIEPAEYDGAAAASGEDESSDAPAEREAAAVDGEDEEPLAEQTTASAEAEDLDRELLEIFLQEGAELLDAADGLMQRWRHNTADREAVAELQRDLHTLKGGARMAGLHAVGDLGHVLESVFEAVNDGQVEAQSQTFQRIEAALDHLHRDLESAEAGRAASDPGALIADLDALLGRAAPTDEAEAVSGFEAAAAADEEAPARSRVVRFTSEDLESAAQAQRERALSGQQEMVRVRAELLDNLVNYAGEISIYRSRLDQQVGAIRFNLVELAQTVVRLREQLRKLEIETEAQILSRLQREGVLPEDESVDLEQFDPLELDRFSQMQQYSRALAESVTDLVNIEDILSGLTRESETLLLQQSRINSDLQEGLMRTRMVPFSSQVPRLRRLLRRTADELQRQAKLEVVGAEGEMDRTVLERMTAPLEHMIRNALAHGIETPKERKAAGKPEEGLIQISIRREASEVVIEVSDDGRGIDLDAVRETAVKRGLLKKGSELTEHDTLGFILETGFSTAEEVSKVAGRGVGMDVVHAEIKQLSGTLDINSHSGQGTQFTIRLPFTLAVTQALMIRVGDENFAVPLSGIEGVVRVEHEEFNTLMAQGEDARLNYGDEDYEVQDLAILLGQEAHHTGDQSFVPVLIVRTGDRRAAVRVDELLGSREVVVKSVGPQLSTVPGIFGATILGDGSVILILDLLPLVRRGAALHLLPEEMRVAREEVEKDLRPTIMVVDDSITMRKVTSRILERHDMEVLTAKDGVDAVALLQESLPDVMLLDIEMPRMDGYELATHIRNDSRLKNIPIIMITSRTGAKHRERAEGLGVDKYMGKPYQEADLMQHINALLEEVQGAA